MWPKCSENLLVEILFRHAIMTFKVVGLWQSRTKSDGWSDPGLILG
jgi:hypothetical protein